MTVQKSCEILLQVIEEMIFNQIIFIFIISIIFISHNVLSFLSENPIKSVNTQFVQIPITKVDKNPVLIVSDPNSNCKVHLVGVSHGSLASSELVRDTILKNNPKAIVVELCEDRFLSVSLDTLIKPRNDEEMIKFYESKVEKAINLKKQPFIKQINAIFRFITSQGLIGGIFVFIGLFARMLQSLNRYDSNNFSKGHGDEFVTSMILAEQLNIPIKLGDASQNDTLASIRNVLSWDTFTPNLIIEGTILLCFSAFGILNNQIDSILSINDKNETLNDNSILSMQDDSYFEQSSINESLNLNNNDNQSHTTINNNNNNYYMSNNDINIKNRMNSFNSLAVNNDIISVNSLASNTSLTSSENEAIFMQLQVCLLNLQTKVSDFIFYIYIL